MASPWENVDEIWEASDVPDAWSAIASPGEGTTSAAKEERSTSEDNEDMVPKKRNHNLCLQHAMHRPRPKAQEVRNVWFSSNDTRIWVGYPNGQSNRAAGSDRKTRRAEGRDKIGTIAGEELWPNAGKKGVGDVVNGRQ